MGAKFAVVPAKAGTHDHRTWLWRTTGPRILPARLACRSNGRGRCSWVPAFAGVAVDHAEPGEMRIDAARVFLQRAILAERARTRNVDAQLLHDLTGEGDITSTRSEWPTASSTLWVMNTPSSLTAWSSNRLHSWAQAPPSPVPPRPISRAEGQKIKRVRRRRRRGSPFRMRPSHLKRRLSGGFRVVG